MKTIYLSAFLALVIPLASDAQVARPNGTTTSPFQPNGAFVNAGPGLPGGAAANGLPSSPVNRGLPGFTNAFGGLNLTNQFGSNLVPANLAGLIANLENDMLQLLPVLAAYNNSIDFSSNPGAKTPAIVPTSTANLGASFGTNTSSRSSGNFGANVSGSSAAPTFGTSTTSSGTANPAGTTTLSPTGVSNPSGAQPNFNNGSTLNPSVLTSAARSSVRDLLILESDIERTLPLVNALNGGGDLTGLLGTNSSALPSNFNGSIGTAFPGSNSRGTVTTPARQGVLANPAVRR